MLLFEESFEDAFFAGVVLLAERLGELAKQFLLLCVQVLRGFDEDGDDEVAASFGVYVGDSLAAKGEGGARLSSLGDLVLLGLAAEDRDIDLSTQRCLGEADGNVAVEVVAVTSEDLVILDSYLDDEVAVVAAVSAGRALSAQDYSLHRVDTCRDRYLELLINLDVALAVTVLAGVFDDLTGSAALLTGALCLHISEHGLLLDGDASRTATVRAGLGSRTLLGA